MAAAERLLRAQGGTLTVEGDASLGARVCVRLPIARTDVAAVLDQEWSAPAPQLAAMAGENLTQSALSQPAEAALR